MGRKQVREALSITPETMTVTFKNYDGRYPEKVDINLWISDEVRPAWHDSATWWNTHASKGDMIELLFRLGQPRPASGASFGTLATLCRNAIREGATLDEKPRHQIVTVPPSDDDADDDDEIPTVKDETKETETSDDASALAEALRRVIGNAVDETKVREIVDNALRENADMFASPPPVQVVRSDGSEIGRVDGITHKVLPRVLRYVQTRPLYLLGEAGTGKTTIASHVAQALGVPMFDMSCSEDMSAHHFAGYMDYRSEFVETVIYRWAKSDSGLLYLDEFDSITGECSTWLNSGFANKRFIFANGEALTLNGEHYILASGNTNLQGAADGYTRQIVDKATIDRFRFLIVEIDENVLKSEIGRYVDADTATKVYNIWRKMRDNAMTYKLDVLVGARIAIYASESMRDGDTIAEAFEVTIKNKLSADIWSKIREGIYWS